MPKMKTKKAAAKRFKITGSGKLVSKHAYRQHDAWGKSKKQRKHAMKQMTIKHSDFKRERDLFPGQL